jgi:hypothetical protein
MKAMLPEYQGACAQGTKKDFFSNTTRALIKKFNIAPSEEAVRVLGREAATQAIWDLYSAVSHLFIGIEVLLLTKL